MFPALAPLLAAALCPVSFDIPPKATPAQMAVISQVVTVGKVVAVPKDLVEAPSPGGDEAVRYKVAVVKVETGLVGADGLKEIKVGVPHHSEEGIELKDGQRLLLFLIKHPHAELYLTPMWINSIHAPFDLGAAVGREALQEVRRALAVVANPLRALKAETAEARAEAAVLLVMKYRSSPEYGEADEVKLDAEESGLILKGLVGVPWKMRDEGPAKTDNPYHAFVLLPLVEQPGWTDPLRAFQPGDDYAALSKAALVKWLAGPGKGYRLTKLAPK